MASSLLLLALDGCAPDEPRAPAPASTGPGSTARSSAARTTTAEWWTGYTTNGVAPGWEVWLDGGVGCFACSAAGAGDVNGDGFDDVIVGASQYESGEDSEGAAFVYLGSAAGPSASPNWSAESDQAFAYLGSRVAPAGDVNGDGYDDVLASAYEYDDGETDEGVVFVYLGSAVGPTTTPYWTGEADQPSAWFGLGAASAGDLNGDGFADVAVGAPFFDDGERDEGEVFVYLGSPSGPSGPTDWTAEGDTVSGLFGLAVASAGDVDADGYDDLLVGFPGSDGGETDEGAALLYRGSATGLSTTPDWRVESDQVDGELGTAVASAGDLNADGYADVVVGAMYYDDGEAGEGAAFVYLGSPSGPSLVADWTAESNQSDGHFGETLASAGDVNADGYDDLLIGARAIDAADLDVGATFLYLGSPAGLSSAADWTAGGDGRNERLGQAVGAAGDLDGDGVDDLLVSAYRVERGDVGGGILWAWYGVADFAGDADGFLSPEDCDDADPTVNPSATEACDGLDNDCDGAVDESGDPAPFHPDVDVDGYGDPSVTLDACPAPPGYILDDRDCDDASASIHPGASEVLDGLDDNCDGLADEQGGALSGASVAYVGDVDGDGYDDLLVGAPGYTDGESAEGAASLHLGGPDGLSVEAVWVVASGQADAGFGRAVAGAGDVNGDGHADLLVGAEGYDGGGVDDGRASVYLGGADGASAVADWTTGPDQAGAVCGAAVAGAGDVNGDGFDDVLVGCPGYDGAAADEGRVDLYLGSATGLAATPAWTLTSGQAGARLGASVAGAGDVNGDGLGDVLVGAPSFDGSAVDAGAASVYLGSATGLGASAAWSGEGDAEGAAFGAALATAGDVNGDGFDDVLVGAPRDDAHHADLGRASVYLGSATGIAAESPWSTTASYSRDRTGFAVAGAGDLNHDGYDDVVVSEPGYRLPAGTGRARLFFGSSGWPRPSSNGSVDASDDDVLFGWSVTVAGDLDGDGFADLVVGLPGLDEPEEDAGGVVVQGGSVDFWLDADGYAAPDDCDEHNAEVHPGAVEACDGVDNDCDGVVDESGDPVEVYLDADADGYGDPATVTDACPVPPGYVYVAGDCDDADSAVHPHASEVCDEVDNNCNGYADEGVSTLWYLDGDGDGYGGSDGVWASCTLPAGYGVDDSDCDDTNAATHPGATEVVGDERDEDCDGAEICYAERDDDGYRGDEEIASADVACDGEWEAPAREADGDCDDTDPAVHPSAAELCDGLDNDCDHHVDEGLGALWYADVDADGYGDPSSPVTACVAPSGYVAASGDCDDADPAVSPVAAEVCDGADNDCDTLVDDVDLPPALWYADADGDGYGDPSTAVSTACPPPGYVPDRTDCDDARADVNPGGDEVPDDGADNDCDGQKAVTKGAYAEEGPSAAGCGCATGEPGAPGPWASPEAGLLVALALAGVRRRRG